MSARTGHGDPAAARVLVDLATASWWSEALHAAAALRLADHVAAGATDPVTLAARAEVRPDGIVRLMQLLSVAGVFAGDERTGYRLTPASHLLRSDVDGSMRDLCLIYGEEFRQAWGSVLDALRTGRTGFEEAFGRTLHDHLTDEPGAGAKFLGAMDAGTTFFQDVPDAFDFGSVGTVTDLAGGSGMLLGTVLAEHPHLHGTLMDRPHMFPVAQRYLGARLGTDRWRIVAGDLFDSVPSGSDVYLLSRVLQDWDDDRCVHLLGNVRRAMTAPSCRLLIVERVLDRDGRRLLPLLYDLHMMVMAGGRARSLDGYESVLGKAGMAVESVHELALETSLLVAAPT